MSEKLPTSTPYNFKHTDIFLGCYFTDYLIDHYQDYLNEDLAKLAEEIDSIRVSNNEAAINRKLFMQLRDIFHVVVSVSSAQIEGNETTLMEYAKTKWDTNFYVPQNIKEIQNIERAINFIDNHTHSGAINKDFICKLQSIIVDGLQASPNGTGDQNPGEYRTNNPVFENHLHLPPHWEQTEEYMDKLINFINEPNDPKYDLLKATVAQHRLVWIHPFNNGNGRLSRLLSYAMIIKASKADKKILRRNPALVLCKNGYYANLAEADKLSEKGITAWIEFIFTSIKDEISKLNTLTSYDYLKENILKPAINRSHDKKLINDYEAQILLMAVEKQVIQASDVKLVYTTKADAEISREIKRMIDKKILVQEAIGTRKYVIRFDKNFLISEIFNIVDELGFLKLLNHN